MHKIFFLLAFLTLLLFSCQKNSSTTQTTINTETADWMQHVITAHPNASLYDLAVPGSHDAGTYLFTECTPGANTCNTQTQFKNITEQLNAGLRIFDIRPVLFNNKYYTQHATDCGGMGCKGDLLSSMFSQVSSFLDQHSEFIILELSHFCNASYNDAAFVSLINTTFGDKLYKETTPDTVSFIHKHLANIIPPGAKGKVMIIYEGASDSPSNRANGIFTNAMQPTEGGWSNSHNLGDLKTQQANNYANYSNSGNTIFQFSWQITQSDQMAVDCAIWPDTASIGELATRANVTLGPFVDSLITDGKIKKGRIPNVIFVDFADEFITNLCIRLNKLNLE